MQDEEQHEHVTNPHPSGELPGCAGCELQCNCPGEPERLPAHELCVHCAAYVSAEEIDASLDARVKGSRP